MDAPREDQLMPVKTVPVLPAPTALEGEAGVLPGSPRDIIYRAYLEGDGQEGPAELAVRYGRPLIEVLHWFRDGNWVRVRKELLSVLKEHNDQSLRDFTAAGRLQTAREQAATGAALEGLVNKMIEDAREGRLVKSDGSSMRLSPNALKTIAESAATAAALRARTFGLSEKAAAEAAAAAAAEVPRQLGLIVLDRSGPTAPAPVTVQPIDVKPAGPATQQ